MRNLCTVMRQDIGAAAAAEARPRAVGGAAARC
jgi:hypothetical protein